MSELTNDFILEQLCEMQVSSTIKSALALTLIAQLIATMLREERLRQALHEIGGYVMTVMQDDVGPRGAMIRGGIILDIVNPALKRCEYPDNA